MAITTNPPIGAVTDGTGAGMIVQSQMACAELDCTDTDTPTVVLIPEELNANGLIIKRIFAFVTEAFGGDTEDQGIVTVSDESNNSLATLTPSDGGADAVNDLVQGSSNSTDNATGTALAQVAAGEYVDCVVTQNSSGASAAGKMLVCVEFFPIPSKE